MNHRNHKVRRCNRRGKVPLQCCLYICVFADKPCIPTASVQRNVDFLKNMSAAAIWRNAPSTIRQGGSLQPPQKVKTPNLTATEDHHETNITSINNATPIRHGNPKNNGMAHPTESTNIRFNTPGHTSRQTPQPYIRPMDDNTTATFHSTASTTLNSSQKCANDSPNSKHR